MSRPRPHAAPPGARWAWPEVILAGFTAPITPGSAPSPAVTKRNASRYQFPLASPSNRRTPGKPGATLPGAPAFRAKRVRRGLVLVVLVVVALVRVVHVGVVLVLVALVRVVVGHVNLRADAPIGGHRGAVRPLNRGPLRRIISSLQGPSNVPTPGLRVGRHSRFSPIRPGGTASQNRSGRRSPIGDPAAAWRPLIGGMCRTRIGLHSSAADWLLTNENVATCSLGSSRERDGGGCAGFGPAVPAHRSADSRWVTRHH